MMMDALAIIAIIATFICCLVCRHLYRIGYCQCNESRDNDWWHNQDNVLPQQTIESPETINYTDNLQQDYMKWNSIDVYHWFIMLHNGYFQKYKDILLLKLQKQNINGQNLWKLNIDNVDELGITDVKDKMLLLANILKLMRNEMKRRDSLQDRFAKIVINSSHTNDNSQLQSFHTTNDENNKVLPLHRAFSIY